MICNDKDKPSLAVIESPHIISSDLVAMLDLTGVDLEGMEVLVANILCGGYLEKPGIEDRGEAVLYVLVNEALHQMEWIRKKELPD